MGCSIHLITEMYKDGKWKYIQENPETFTHRDYTLFSVLANNTRNYFATKGFRPKGLPEDISSKHFVWESDRDYALKQFETAEWGILCLRTSDGDYIRTDDKSHPLIEKCKIEITKAEYDFISEKIRNNDSEFLDRYTNLYESFSKEEGRHYHASDASIVSGSWKKLPFKNFYINFDTFLRQYHCDDFNEEMNDIGRWDINFEDNDWFNHSWLTLKELQDFPLDDYCSEKVKVPKFFYDKFIELGGTIPEGMTINSEEREPADLFDCFQQALCPDVIASWPGDRNDKERFPLLKGIDELSEIAQKYECSPEEIRIVFAFDN